MEKINVRFSDTQRLKINDLSEVTECSFSEISRAAMELGLNQIRTLASIDPEKANKLVVINDYKAK